MRPLMQTKTSWATFKYDVVQGDQIPIKLKVTMPCHLPNVCTEFETDISDMLKKGSMRKHI